MKPRAYTPDEIRDMILMQIRATVKYWATLPDVDKATGYELTVEDRCDGVAFSILTMLDGGTTILPAVTLKMDPHEDDKAFLQAAGENWIEPDTEISDMLHEHYSALVKSV